MKSLFKNLTIGLMIALLALSYPTYQVQAAVVVVPSPAPGPTSLLSTGGLINEIIIANDTAAELAITLYDSPVASIDYTTPGYNTRISSVVMITNILITITGVTNTTIYPALQTVDTVIAGSTLQYPPVVSLKIPASGTVSWVPIGGFNATLGITSVNDQDATVTIDYNLK